MEISFLTEQDFNRAINEFTNKIIQPLIIKKDNNTQTTSINQNSFLKKLQQGIIYYDLTNNVFRGGFTLNDKIYLQEIGAIYLKSKHGYHKPFLLLPIEMQEIIDSLHWQRKAMLNYAMERKDANSINIDFLLVEDFTKILERLLLFHLVRKFAISKTKASNYINLASFINQISLSSVIYHVLNGKINSFLKKIVLNHITNEELRQEFNQSLKIALFDEIGFLLRNALFDIQKKIANIEYKTSLFLWEHRDPPQPQDRKVHIRWWRSGRKFDFNNLPINPETGQADFPGKLIHCHCRAKIIVF